jgi:hypothetical protein
MIYNLFHQKGKHAKQMFEIFGVVFILLSHVTGNYQALPETASLSSVICFAECQISGTRQRASLPSAALGKTRHSAKVDTQQNNLFAEGQTLGKVRHSAKPLLGNGHDPSSTFAERQDTLCRGPGSGTRQNILFYFGPQIFCADLLQYHVLHVKILYFFVAFCYI